MNIVKERLHSQLLGSFQAKTPYEVVKHMVCMQAQDWGQSKWAIASRVVGGCTVKDVEQAYTDGQIVRTWTQRGTIHAVATEDVSMMIELCASKTRSGFKKRRLWLGMDDEVSEKALDIFEKALTGGRELTRKEMLASLEKAGLELQTGRGYHLLCYAGTKGLIVMGPMKDGEQAFVLLKERKAKNKAHNDVLLKELILRYFASHGPATIADFARWSGLGITQIKQGIALCGDDLNSEGIGNQVYYYIDTIFGERIKTVSPAGSRSAHFLAGFDEFLLGYKDRTATLELAHHAHVDTSRNGVFKPTVMIDGKTVAIWGSDLKKKNPFIWIKPFVQLSDSDYQLLQKGMGEYGTYIGKELIITVL